MLGSRHGDLRQRVGAEPVRVEWIKHLYIQLAIHLPHFGTFLSAGKWHISDVYNHTRGLVPSMQLRRIADTLAARHVLWKVRR